MAWWRRREGSVGSNAGDVASPLGIISSSLTLEDFDDRLPSTAGAFERFDVLAGIKLGDKSGLHRLQALKPSPSASFGLAKKTMFACRARRDGQVGRQ